MYNIDTRTVMYQNILDTHTLINACSTDINIRKQCSKKSFWEPVYIINNLPLPFTNYTVTEDWINDYVKSKSSMDIVNDILIRYRSYTVEFLTIGVVTLQQFINIMKDLQIKTTMSISDKQQKVYLLMVDVRAGILDYYNRNMQIISEHPISIQQLKEFLYITLKHNLIKIKEY